MFTLITSPPRPDNTTFFLYNKIYHKTPSNTNFLARWKNHMDISKALWYLVLLKGDGQMKKQIIAVITVAACVALRASVWPRSAEAESLPAEPVKTTVNAEIEARSSETPHIFISEGMPAPESKPIAESNSTKTEITAEKETEKQAIMQTVQSVKPTASSSEPYNGDVRFIDGEKQIYLLVFGWIKEDGGGSVGTMVGNPNDQLTGHKVGIMGGGTTVDGKGDINKMVGIMGRGDDPAKDNPVLK
jgi:hypothetical protein